MGDRPGGRAHADQPAACARLGAGRPDWDSCRAGRHGPPRPGAADQRRLWRGGGHPGPPPGSGAAASRRRGPGPGRCRVLRQDRHPHRRDHHVRHPHPARRSGPRRGGARRARRRGEPERDAGRHRAGLPATGPVGAPGRGAVLLSAQVERRQLHRARHLGAGGTGDGAAQRTPGAPGTGHGTRRQRTPDPRAGPGRGIPERPVAPAGPATRRVHRVRGTAEIRHHRDHRVFRGAAGRVEGDLRGQPAHCQRRRQARGPAPGRATPSTHGTCRKTPPRSAPCWRSGPCSAG